MTQNKDQKGPSQKHLHSRVSYLFQAAAYLSAVTTNSPPEVIEPNSPAKPAKGFCGDDRYERAKASSGKESKPSEIQNVFFGTALLAQARAISLKSQIKLTPTMKKSICKRCNTMLTPGSTASVRIENKSCNGRKSWADVLVVTCTACGAAKRQPVGAKRQSKKHNRVLESSSSGHQPVDNIRAQ